MAKQPMGNLVGDAAALLLNVAASVVVILVNKVLMGADGFGYTFAVSLTGAHFMASAAAMHLFRLLGFLKPGPEVPIKDLTILVSTHCLCVLCLNLSLMINTVGFYQIAKLMIIPFLCFLEYTWLSQSFSVPVLLSVALVVTGVGVVTVTDVSVTLTGLLIAGMSVVSTGVMQITCRTIQKTYGVTSSNLLLKAGVPMGTVMLTIGPFVDKFVSGQWVSSYDYTWSSVGLIVGSSLVAVLVNMSSFMCLGRFSAVTFQVMGHTKTFLVLAGGFLLFNEALGLKQICGMISAIGGMMLYGYFKNKYENESRKELNEIEPEEKPLLENKDTLPQSEKVL